MHVFSDENERHIPLVFLDNWPVPQEYKNELRINGIQKEGYLIIANQAYSYIHEKYFPSPISKSYSLPPGLLLSKVIQKITGNKAAQCSYCSEKARQMNNWGWWGCWKRRNIIIEWITEEAIKLGYVVDKRGMLSLFKIAIREIRK